jgi:hypothetical protein
MILVSGASGREKVSSFGLLRATFCRKRSVSAWKEVKDPPSSSKTLKLGPDNTFIAFSCPQSSIQRRHISNLSSRSNCIQHMIFDTKIPFETRNRKSWTDDSYRTRSSSTLLVGCVFGRFGSVNLLCAAFEGR